MLDAHEELVAKQEQQQVVYGTNHSHEGLAQSHPNYAVNYYIYFCTVYITCLKSPAQFRSVLI